MKNAVGSFRKAWITALSLTIVILVWLAIVPFGTIRYSTDFLSRDYFISKLTPADRLEGQKGVAARTVTGEPVYFSLFTPRPFRTATVTVEYDKEVPLLEIGLRRDSVVWNYERQPLQVAVLDRLSSDPNTIRDGDSMLWQKTPRYSSVKDFLQSLPPVDTVVTYNYNLQKPFIIEDYKASTVSRVVPVAARGNYVMNVYSGGEAIEFTFLVRDLNKNKDSDSVSILLYDTAGKVVAETELADDGALTETVSSAREINVVTGKMPAGVYRLEFKANDDIVTESIETKQSKFAFVNRLWLAESDRRDFSIYTDAAALSVQTTAAAGKQTLIFDGQPLQLTETYMQYKAVSGDQTRRLKKIELKRDGVIVAADGMFAMTADSLFNSAARQLSDKTIPETDGTEFIIARYKKADALKRSVTFELGNAYRENGTYSFLIAVPGISDIPGGLEIKSVTVTLEGETLLGYLKKLF